MRDMVKAGMPITKIAARLKCSRHTVYKALALARMVEAEGRRLGGRRAPFLSCEPDTCLSIPPGLAGAGTEQHVCFC